VQDLSQVFFIIQHNMLLLQCIKVHISHPDVFYPSFQFKISLLVILMRVGIF